MTNAQTRSNMSSSPCSSTSSVSSSYSSLSLPSTNNNHHQEKKNSSSASSTSSSSSSSTSSSSKLVHPLKANNNNHDGTEYQNEKTAQKVTDVDKKIHSNLEEAYALINKAKLNSNTISSMSGLDNRFKNNTMSSNQTSIKPTSKQMSSTKTFILCLNQIRSYLSIQNNQVRCDDECTIVYYSNDFLALHKINQYFNINFNII